MDPDRLKENREDSRIAECGFDGEDVEVCVEDHSTADQVTDPW